MPWDWGNSPSLKSLKSVILDFLSEFYVAKPPLEAALRFGLKLFLKVFLIANQKTWELGLPGFEEFPAKTGKSIRLK